MKSSLQEGNVTNCKKNSSTEYDKPLFFWFFSEKLEYLCINVIKLAKKNGD